MSVPKCPAIKTKEEFKRASILLGSSIVGLSMVAAIAPGAVDSQFDEAFAYLGSLREGVEAAPFVLDDSNMAIDATPELKAAENAKIATCFDNVSLLAKLAGAMEPEPVDEKPADDGGILVETRGGLIRFVPTPVAEAVGASC